MRGERIRIPEYRVPDDASWWVMEDISDTGDTGDSSKGSKEKGEKILAKMADAFCEYLKEFDERTKHWNSPIGEPPFAPFPGPWVRFTRASP